MSCEEEDTCPMRRRIHRRRIHVYREALSVLAPTLPLLLYVYISVYIMLELYIVLESEAVSALPLLRLLPLLLHVFMSV
jgi:hypothetical protein